MADRTRKREQQPLQLPQQNKRQKRQGELTSEKRKDRKCVECNDKLPIYGLKGGTAKDAKWCKQCKPADAVDIVNKRCLTENCDTIVQNRALKTESPRGNGGGLRVDALLSPAPVSKGGEDRCEPGSLGPSPRVVTLCKKPISSFALFANAIRPRLKREYPQMPLAEIARETGRQWKALSVDEQAKWNTASKN